ncbi:MAG: hypothetical protein RJA57_1110 [Bacteroidota bacterium]
MGCDPVTVYLLIKHRFMKSLFIYSLWFLLLQSLVSAAQDPADTLLQEEEDPTLRFFRNAEKPSDAERFTLVGINGQTMTLAAWLKQKAYQSGEQVLADLDHDGRKELLLYGYTGGAHCCDAITVFRESAPRRYQQAGTLYAGHTIVKSDGTFLFDLYEQFGYFFTCYACGLTDTSDAAPIDVSVVRVIYTKGRLAVVPGDQELRSLILDNLGKLRERPYVKFDDAVIQDEGQRKAFALNLAVYYFSFGKNLTATRQLFFQYYKFPDAVTVWAAFLKTLNGVRRGNSF